MLVCGTSAVSAQSGVLGTAQQFGVLGASTVTNTGSSVIKGDLGLYAGTSITGFPPGTVLGTVHQTDGVAQLGQHDATAAYTSLAALAPTQTLTGQDLGTVSSASHPLRPGVYFFASSAQLTGDLFLDFTGSAPNSMFVFQIGSALTTASGASVSEINGGPGDNVFWQVVSSATLGTATTFEGSIIADQSVTLTTGANIACGRAIALNGAVTMDTNVISDECGSGVGGSTVPEPTSVALLGTGLVGLAPALRRRRKS